MPIEYTIDHEKRFVHARVMGVIALKDIEAFTDVVVAQNALTYRKLFDGSQGDGTYDDQDVMALAARAAAYASLAKRGPLALVPRPGFGADLARRFINLGKFTGQAQIFESAEEGLKWLEAQPEGEP
ncbi:MAG: hypothetical protein EPO41_06925 [Reyranella sp.]|uniref:hypothetical protein n=1 Tax=Reyranella sp. TaxID=1929291 RepID=UPI00122858C6|nr:hypothetical protein [Reyranella sp.]TAJ96449.1 MAG: hypothetical protein EPO41_06925 [Reyranella sp.]